MFLGNLEAIRDWGYAREYVEGMWRMMQAETPTDYVLATGKPASVRDFLETCFAEVGLEWERHVEFDPRYLRPTEVDALIGDPSKAHRELGWRADTDAFALARLMTRYEVAILEGVDPLVAERQVAGEASIDA